MKPISAIRLIRMSKLPIILVFFLSTFNGISSASDGNVRQNNKAYDPSYVDYKTPLSLFVSADLLQACEDLKANRLTQAQSAFNADIQRHPDNLADYIGLLQSMPEHDDALLKQYQKEEESNPSTSNEFKLGLLEFYKFGELQAISNSQSDLEKKSLGELARKHLQQAYDLSHSLVIGFTLASASSSTPGDFNVLNLFEDMLKHLGGAKTFSAYEYAKTKLWTSSLPPLPKISSNDLRILERIVSNLRAQNDVRLGTIVESKEKGKKILRVVPDPYTQEQQQAIIYLQKWQNSIKAAISRFTSVHS